MTWDMVSAYDIDFGSLARTSAGVIQVHSWTWRPGTRTIEIHGRISQPSIMATVILDAHSDIAVHARAHSHCANPVE